MKEYYIYLDGNKQGPFSLEDLQHQMITRDTLIWRAGTASPVPAHQVADLKPIFEKEQSTSLDTNLHSSPGDHDHKQIIGNVRVDSPRTYRRGMRIAILILLLALVGTGIYFLIGRPDGVQQKEDIGAIHEREVKKAMDELKAEKLTKKNAELRKQLLNDRKAELQLLNAQLNHVRSSRAGALSEMDDIRRPRLFRSRAKKEAQLAEQLEIIDRLDVKAAKLTNKISRCQEAVDSLSAGIQP